MPPIAQGILMIAQEKGATQDVKFCINSIDVELEVVAKKEVGSSVKVKWFLFEGSAAVGAEKVCTHKLKLSIQAFTVEEKDGRQGKRLVEVNELTEERP